MFEMFLIFLNSFYLAKRTRHPSKNILKGCLVVLISPFILLIIFAVLIRGCAAILGAR